MMATLRKILFYLSSERKNGLPPGETFVEILEEIFGFWHHPKSGVYAVRKGRKKKKLA